MKLINPNARMVIMRGMSGSGKSTDAKKLKDSDPDRWEIVSRDELRKQLMGAKNLERYFEQGQNIGVEQVITTQEHDAIARVLAQGKDVIIDNTNVRPKYIAEYLKIARDFGLTPDDSIVYNCDGVSVDEAFERVKNRGERFVPKGIIQRQADTLRSCPSGLEFDKYTKNMLDNYKPKKWFLPPFNVEKYTPNPQFPKAIICDLDGTLTHRALLTEPEIHYRSFYEYGKCDTDLVDPLVADVLKGLHLQGYELIFVSGRKNDCRRESVEFIQRALGLDEQHYTLLMRDPEIDIHEENGQIFDDHDDNVKYRIFNTYLRKDSNIVGVIDDRKRVVALWEALGLRVLNVGLLNEDF